MLPLLNCNATPFFLCNIHLANIRDYKYWIYPVKWVLAVIQREMDTVLDQPHAPGICKLGEDHANAM